MPGCAEFEPQVPWVCGSLFALSLGAALRSAVVWADAIAYLACSSRLQSDEHPGQGQERAQHSDSAGACELADDFVAKLVSFRGIHPLVLRGLPRVLL